MKEDTKNMVYVLLSLVIVVVVVLGGGYIYLNYGDSLLTRDTKNKTVVPKKTEETEVALTLDDSRVVNLLSNLDGLRIRETILPGTTLITKVGYARNIISTREDVINIYEYYALKEVVIDMYGNETYKYYSDYEKSSLIIESIENIEDTLFDTYSDNVGIYKYSFKKNNNDVYVFTGVEKIK